MAIHPADLDRITQGTVESFVGVGYFLDLAAIRRGEAILDLGSGSRTDSLLAGIATTKDGRVVGVDMTNQQIAKARRLAAPWRLHARRLPDWLHRAAARRGGGV